MDFDSLLYSLLIGGTIVWSIVKKIKKEEAPRRVNKDRTRPITVEPSDVAEEVKPKRQTVRNVSRPEPGNEYFSYETMSERDFEQAFAENAPSETVTAQNTEKPHINLSLDEEDVFKGIVWSEILKRKY